MLPSPAELNYFLEISNSLNFSRAAERLGISQPSLSLAMQRLEQSIGTHLFIRHQHGVTLTQAGKQLLLHVRKLLEDWNKTKSQALASHQAVQGFFTIGCHSTIAIHILADCLPNLLEDNRKLEIQLKHDISRKITENVINMSADIGIVANPLMHPDLIIHKLCNDEVAFFVASGVKKIQDINSNQAVILCDSELTQTQSLLKSTRKKLTQHARIIKMNSLEVVAKLTAQGCGIGILPTRVADAMFPGEFKKLSNLPVHRDELCLIYRNENRNIHAVQVILEAIKHLFR